MSSTKHLPVNRLSLWFKYSALVVLLILSVITFIMAGNGQLQALDEALLGSVYADNEAFLKDASNRAESMSLLLTELHAGLMVLQSSEFGISFIVDANIQLGNIIAQLTDLVAYGRNFALFNLMALHMIDNLLTLFQWLSPWLIVLALSGLLAIVTADTWLSTRNRWHMSLIRLGEGAVIVVVLLVLVFPLAINLVSHSSDAVTRMLHHESYQAVKDSREHILGDTSGTSIKDDASASLSQFKTVKANLSVKSSYLTSHLTQYAASTFLEVFLLPMLFSLLMLWLLRSLVRRHRHWNL